VDASFTGQFLRNVLPPARLAAAAA
jgi:hypothetical protein